MGKDKLVNCRVCGAEIAHSAKKCPKCGAKQKKSHLFRSLFLLIIVAFILFVGIGRGMINRKKATTINAVQAAQSVISDSSETNSDDNEDKDESIITEQSENEVEETSPEVDSFSKDEDEGEEASPEVDSFSEGEDNSGETTQVGLTPEFKAFMDSYEDYMNEYVDFMEKYDQSDITMLTKYTSMMVKLTEFSEKIDSYNEDNLSAEDFKYYIDVTSRVNKRMADVSFSLN